MEGEKDVVLEYEQNINKNYVTSDVSVYIDISFLGFVLYSVTAVVLLHFIMVVMSNIRHR